MAIIPFKDTEQNCGKSKDFFGLNGIPERFTAELISSRIRWDRYPAVIARPTASAIFSPIPNSPEPDIAAKPMTKAAGIE